jgi:hypothetical protein
MNLGIGFMDDVAGRVCGFWLFEDNCLGNSLVGGCLGNSIVGGCCTFHFIEYCVFSMLDYRNFHLQIWHELKLVCMMNIWIERGGGISLPSWKVEVRFELYSFKCTRESKNGISYYKAHKLLMRDADNTLRPTVKTNRRE